MQDMKAMKVQIAEVMQQMTNASNLNALRQPQQAPQILVPPQMMPAPSSMMMVPYTVYQRYSMHQTGGLQ